MKIYTKKGDDGKTMLLGGTRLPKHHIRIAAYGDVDELNSFIGLVSDLLPSHQETLREIQNNLFVVGSHLATEPDQAEKIQLPALPENASENLENEIILISNDLYNDQHDTDLQLDHSSSPGKSEEDSFELPTIVSD